MSLNSKKFQFEFSPGATPLDPNEAMGLIPNYISTQGELNILEQENILQARTWLGSNQKEILSDTFFRELHRKMFGEVWKWAGKYRLSGKSIGIHWPQVPVEVTKLLSDVSYWISNGTYDWDELGARFHHRAVSIHAFPNGNGRHARLMTDLVMMNHGKKLFSWGAGDLEYSGLVRSNYISALKEADERRYTRLIHFIRS